MRVGLTRTFFRLPVIWIFLHRSLLFFRQYKYGQRGAELSGEVVFSSESVAEDVQGGAW
jgi:hypothetical protein